MLQSMKLEKDFQNHLYSMKNSDMKNNSNRN